MKPTLIRNAHIHAPDPLGPQDILIAGHSIAAVEPSIDLAGAHVHILEANGRILVPGLVDALTHPCGGGGEGGFGNRTPELSAADFAQAGITSPVGALGTDSITRSLEVLFGHIMGLRAQGIDAYMYTGAYRVPPATLTGEVMRDLVLIDPIIGVGEVAISDHRSSAPTIEELRRIGADSRVGGIVAGKAGTILVHVGDGEIGLSPLREALKGSDLPITTFYPTHANRNQRLLADAMDFARGGAAIDFTVSTTPEFIADGEVPALRALREALTNDIPADRLTMSSDAGGSLPHYKDGELVGLQPAPPSSLIQSLREAASVSDELFTAALAAMTRNPARVLGLAQKGRIHPGHDADLLLLDADSLALTDVMCRGRWLFRDNQLLC